MTGMEFQEHVRQYQESSQAVHSPVWIWFVRSGEGSSTCLICQKDVRVKSGSTSNLILHLRRHHGEKTDYNAFKDYEDLYKAKQERMNKPKTTLSIAEREDNRLLKKQKQNSRLQAQAGLQTQAYLSSHPRHHSPSHADSETSSLGRSCIMADVIFCLF